jgi:hypothetical protein
MSIHYLLRLNYYLLFPRTAKLNIHQRNLRIPLRNNRLESGEFDIMMRKLLVDHVCLYNRYVNGHMMSRSERGVMSYRDWPVMCHCLDSWNYALGYMVSYRSVVSSDGCGWLYVEKIAFY